MKRSFGVVLRVNTCVSKFFVSISWPKFCDHEIHILWKRIHGSNLSVHYSIGYLLLSPANLISEYFDNIYPLEAFSFADAFDTFRMVFPKSSDSKPACCRTIVMETASLKPSEPNEKNVFEENHAALRGYAGVICLQDYCEI